MEEILHRHAEVGKQTLKIFLITICLIIFQIVFASLTSSMSLWSDTAHVGSDLIAIGIVLAAQWAAHKSHSRGNDHPEEYHAVEIGATVVNGALLILAGGVLVSQVVGRLSNPPHVSGVILIPGAIGLIVNLYVVFRLRKERQHITMQSVIAHVSLDSLASVGVIVAGLLIITTGVKLIDPIISILIIGLIVSWGTRLIWLAATTQVRQNNKMI